MCATKVRDVPTGSLRAVLARLPSHSSLHLLKVVNQNHEMSLKCIHDLKIFKAFQRHTCTPLAFPALHPSHLPCHQVVTAGYILANPYSRFGLGTPSFALIPELPSYIAASHAQQLRSQNQSCALDRWALVPPQELCHKALGELGGRLGFDESV